MQPRGAICLHALLRQSFSISPARREIRRAVLLRASCSLQLDSSGKDAMDDPIEDTYDRYQEFARSGRNVNEADQNRNNNQDDASSDLQTRLRDITTWSLQNNVEESDAYELEKLEDLLRNALRDTRSKKIQKLAKQINGGSTSAAQNCNGASKKEQGKE